MKAIVTFLCRALLIICCSGSSLENQRQTRHRDGGLLKCLRFLLVEMLGTMESLAFYQLAIAFSFA